jgi:uncharacterized protein YkwD
VHRLCFLILAASSLACVGGVIEDYPVNPDGGGSNDPTDGGSVADQDGASPADAGVWADAAAPDAEPTGLSPIEQELYELINEERTSRGLGAVTPRETLICAARRHSDDIGATQSCTHTGSDWSSPGDRVEDCGGGGWSGEIVACGQSTPRRAVDAWLNSPGHRTIMLGSGKREIGVAVTNNYWTAIFDN